jgi:ribosomal protein S18 acetylase RimI-like enzyme
VSVSRFTVTRVRRPGHDLLATLAGYDEEAFGPLGLRTYDLAVVAEAGVVFMAWLGEEVVGGCQLLRVLDEPCYVYILGFYIRPAWRGQGWGRLLLEQVAQECQLAGDEGMVLTVSPQNTSALRFYRRAGFAEEAFIPHFYGTGEDRFVLRWRFGEGALQGGVS